MHADERLPAHGLSARHMAVIRAILAPYVERITRVGLFGSRAMGTARANSDIDMVLMGDLDEALIDHLRTAFDNSPLPVAVDLVAYDGVANPALKTHIDRMMSPLFTREDLRSSAAP